MRFWRVMASVALVMLLGYLAGNGATALWDRDEPRYATASANMLRSGDWVVPEFLGEPRVNKPPMIYWLQAASMSAFGVDEASARLPSSIAMTIAVLMIATFVNRERGPTTAVLTAVTFGSGLLVVGLAKMSVTDAVLLVPTLLAMGALYHLWRGSRTWAVFIALGAGIGLALITKGPVVLAVLATTWLAVALLRLTYKQPTSDASPEEPGAKVPAGMVAVRSVVCVALVIAIVGPWLYLIERRIPGYTLQVIGAEVVERGTTAQEGHSGPPGYYLATIWGTWFPWCLFLPAAILFAWRDRRDPLIRFALASVVGPWILLEIYTTKLPHYLLPAYPGLALLTANVLRRDADCPRELNDRGFRIAAWVWAIGGVAFGLAPWALLIVFGGLDTTGVIGAAALSVVTVAMVVVAGLLMRRGQHANAAVVIAPCTLLMVAIAYTLWLPNAEWLTLSRRAGQLLADSPEPAVMLDYKEPSVAFYQGGTIRERSSATSLTRATPDELPATVLITRRLYDPLPDATKSAYDIAHELEGLPYADEAEPLDVLILHKRVTR